MLKDWIVTRVDHHQLSINGEPQNITSIQGVWEREKETKKNKREKKKKGRIENPKKVSNGRRRKILKNET